MSQACLYNSTGGKNIMSTYTAGMFLPSGADVKPQPMFVTDHTGINQAVGGHFDVVTTDMDQEDVSIVGYVNDEGIILGLEFNYLASALFKRELFGDCVVVWGLNKDGVYDGENHDLPSVVAEFLVEDLVQVTANAYNGALSIALACDYAIRHGYMTELQVAMLASRCAEETAQGQKGSAMQELEVLMEWVVRHTEENEDM
jgi:hypothetical protein